MATVVTCLECGKPFDAGLVANRFGGTCPACLAKFAAGASEPGLDRGPEPAFKPPLKIGGTFHGLEIIELLGAGGMGVVYKARQPGLDRFVALKVLSPKLTTDPEFTARFNREARAMAALNHAGIVQVFDHGQEADLCFLVMEFVEGLSLRHLMKGRRLSPEEALKIVPKICEALEYAHSKGVIHRDIKPENILIDREGRVKIADFGLARLIAGNDPASRVTVTNVVMGTPGYMAPEQYQSMSVDHRADIYSLGAIFYEMLTGQLPVGRFDPPSRKIQVDVRLDEIVLKALENEPDRRYQRAVDVKTDVENMGATRPPVGSPAVAMGPSPVRKAIRVLLMIPVTLIASVMLAMIAVEVARAELRVAIFSLVLGVIVLIGYRKIHFALGDWARRPGPTHRTRSGPRTSGWAVASLCFLISSYLVLAALLIINEIVPNPVFRNSAQNETAAVASLLLLQGGALIASIIALSQIGQSGGRLTGRLYAYLAVFLILPPIGQMAGYIMWRVFDRIPEPSRTGTEPEVSSSPRLSALAVTSPEPRAEGKPEVFWLASASIGFALFGAIMTAMATLVLLQVSG